jgi:hypothetical protein
MVKTFVYLPTGHASYFTLTLSFIPKLSRFPLLPVVPHLSSGPFEYTPICMRQWRRKADLVARTKKL